MILAILILITLTFIFINAVIAKYDYMHPMVMLGFGFLLSEIMCVFAIDTYNIVFHADIVFVFLMGFFALTLGNVIGHKRSRIYDITPPKKIVIANKWAILTIIMQVIAIIELIRYFRALNAAYAGLYGESFNTLPGLIKLYNNLTNFWPYAMSRIHVTIPMAYRLFDPISCAAAYIFIYVMVNNFVCTRKVNFYHIVILGLLFFEQLLNSSRTPLLNILTMILILFHVFKYRSGKVVLGSLKGLVRLVFVFLLVAVFSVLFLRVIGRSLDESLLNYFFIYTGAPLVNLDNLIVELNGKTNCVFGIATFGSLYKYVAKLLSIDASGIVPTISLTGFKKSSNGLSTGNVYTMFSAFIVDFSLWGIIPLCALMAFYYSRAYTRALCGKFDAGKIDYGVLIFSFLYNAALMSMFSEKFYGTLTNPPFIKWVIISWCMLQAGKVLERIKVF